MRLTPVNLTANDNEPKNRHPRGDSVGYRAAVRERSRFAKMQADKLKHYDHYLATRPTSRDPWFLMAIALWIGAIGFFTHIFSSGETGLVKIATAIGLIFTSLWVGHASQVRGRERFADVAIFGAIIGCGAGLYTSINDLSVPMTLGEAFAVLTVMTLIAAALLRSRICLIVSACISVVAMIYQFNGVTQTTMFVMFYPAIWILQALYASMLGSRLTVLGMNIIGYFWVAGTGITCINLGILSPQLAIGLLFSMGVFHYHIGKARLRASGSSAILHIIFGWSAAVIAATTIAYDAFNTVNLIQTGLSASPLGLALWKLCIMSLAGACAFVILFQKWIHRQQGADQSRFAQRSLRALIGATISASLPLLILFMPQITELLAQRPELANRPVIALALCGAIFANTMTLALYGINQRRMLLTLIALVATSLLFGLFLKPENIVPENGVIFGSAFLGTFVICGWSIGFFSSFRRAGFQRAGLVYGQSGYGHHRR